jgi:cell division protein FtsB
MSIWVLIHRISLALIIAVALVWAWKLFYPQFKQTRELTTKKDAIELDILRDEETLKHLREKQQRLLSDPRFVEKIAREELGLAKPGETVFKFEDKNGRLNASTSTTNRTP